MSIRSVLSAVLLTALAFSEAIAADGLVVVVGKDAPALEKFAAQELASQFKRLYELPVSVTSSPPKQLNNIVFVGSPGTNEPIRILAGKTWPKLSPQGILIKGLGGNGKAGMIVGGGSPQATLWAVYELGHRLGIRYTLKSDIYPKTPLKLHFEHYLVLEPVLKTRAWRAINDFAMGQESWGLADHRLMLRQLAKMKFNRVMITVYPWQPFVHYEFGGVGKQTALLWYGEKLVIPRDAPGRTALGTKPVFENPDFAGKSTYEEMTKAGIVQVRGIVDEAHRLGMSAAIAISPLEFPREFAKVLPGAKKSRGLNRLVVAPGAEQGPYDKTIRDMVSTKIQAYLKTYPKLDALYLSLPEFPEWEEHVDRSWRDTVDLLGDRAPKLDALLKQVSTRNLIASGERGRRSLKGNIVTLAFLRRLFADDSVLRRPDGKQVELNISSVDPALHPYLRRLLPSQAGTLAFVDYTARRITENGGYLETVPAKKVRSGLYMTLADDNVGVLSQSSTRRLETIVQRMIKNGWDGFVTRHWMLAELDPSVHYLSRAAWDAKTTARSAHDDLFVAITGKQAAADRLWLAFGHIEKATELIDKNQIGFAFPVPGMFMKHYQNKPLPKWWNEVNKEYTNAMTELYRSHDAADPRCRRLLFYWAKRSEYVLEYLAALKATREAALAKGKGDKDKAIEHLETATEQLYNAIDTLSDVARDQSDRGLIAVLINFAYRPLMAEYERLANE